MAKKLFNAYMNESDCIQIGDLTIENRLDRISIYGSIDLTRDKEGLDDARKLKYFICSVVEVLENNSLPDHIAIVAPEIVKNPFE